MVDVNLDRNGKWFLKVTKEFNPHCFSCKKEVETKNKFYVCKEANEFWCYTDRAIGWPKQCEQKDEHNHYCIHYIEVEKDDTKEN